jgi:hypothetical protein
LLSLIHYLTAPERQAASTRKTFRIALVVSLMLHALVLFWPGLREKLQGGGSDSRFIVHSPIQATLAQRAQTRVTPQTETKPVQPHRPSKTTPRQKIIAGRNGSWQIPRDKQVPTPSGAELARRALAMASGMGSTELDQGDDAISTSQDGKGKTPDPFSLSMYFDAFIKKLNSSARFVPHPDRPPGRHVAAVQIVINPDGSLKNYKILYVADQQTEIDYVRSVVERAIPFAAFPPDIRATQKQLTMTLCINPPGAESGFTRTSGAEC